MPRTSLFSRVGIPSRKFSFVFILLFNTFIWFFMDLFIISTRLKTIENNLLAWAIYLVAIVGSSLLGTLRSLQQKRIGLIYAWFFLGIISSCLLSILAIGTSFEYLLVILFFSGVAFGLGMPSTLACFAEYTVFENRGRRSGLIFFVTNFSIPFIALLFGTNVITGSFIAAIWRGAGLMAIFLLKPVGAVEEPRRAVSFGTVFSNRAFILFLIPWFMFCLIDRFEQQIFLNFLQNNPEKYPNLAELSSLIEPIVGTVFALVGGLLSDWIGRKKVIVSGFVALGLAYAVLGVATEVAFSQYFYILIDGIAWGIFLVSFFLILWGDLSSFQGGHEKYYAIGSIPFFIAYLMQYFAQPYIKSIQPEASFSFASLFLFIAVLPLIFAPETLPKKAIKERQIKKYIEEAKKIAEKKVGKKEV
jgi:MFS family permease